MRTTPTRTQTTATRSAPAGAEAALRRTIEPVDADRFREHILEREPLHVPRGEPGRFDHLFSWADAERLVTEPGLRFPAFRLVRAGERIATDSYTVDLSWRPVPFSGTADVRRVVEEFERGATIVLQGLHLLSDAVATYCRELEAALGHPVQANAYLTPRRSQGLPVHHDTHDVFVLQVSGSKRWLVYAPVWELPLKHQRYSPELGAPGEPVLELQLEPGDTLYLPRGWLHEALTSDVDSLHLTVGVNVVTWLDALRAALDRCQDDVEFRRALPADGAGGEALVERLAGRLTAGEVAAAARERFARTRRPVLTGQLSELRALETLTADAPLERRPTVVLDVDEAADGGLGLVFEGRTVWFPAHARAEIEAVVASEAPFTISELPGDLDGAGRLVLVRRLVREGFLRRAE